MAAYIRDLISQLKEQFWLVERVFQNGSLHKGLTFAIKRTILISWTVSHFRGAFGLLSEVGDALEVSPRQTLNTNKLQKPLRSWLIPWMRPRTYHFSRCHQCHNTALWVTNVALSNDGGENVVPFHSAMNCNKWGSDGHKNTHNQTVSTGWCHKPR